MAGTYPDIPGTRFALDLDGSIVKARNLSTGGAWGNAGNLVNLVDSATTYIDVPINAFSGQDTGLIQWAVAFPEPRDITGMYLQATTNQGGVFSDFEYSTDTTDGTDGTWQAITMNGARASSGTLKPYYRDDIYPLALQDVKGFRFRLTLASASGDHSWMRIYAWHIYGFRPITAVDRLAFWDPAADQAAHQAHLDFGDHPQGVQTTKQVRVKNISAGLTANNVAVSISDPITDFGGGLEISDDNVSFLQTIAIGTLAPGEISSVIYVRRTVDPAAQEGLRLARLTVTSDPLA